MQLHYSAFSGLFSAHRLRNMKNVITQIFVTLGVIFLVLLLIGIYLIVADPYGLKPLIFGGDTLTQSQSIPEANTTNDVTVSTSTEMGTATGAGTANGFELSNAQIEALVSLGIDPEAVPESISPAQEACFVDVLGEDQVAEIKDGAVPSALEFMKARSCI